MTPALLRRMSADGRRRLASDLGLADASPGTLAGQIASPTRIAAVLNGLTPAERDALAILVHGMGGRGPRAELLVRLNALRPSERRHPRALSGLERKGLILPAELAGRQVVVYEEVAAAAALAVSARPFEDPRFLATAPEAAYAVHPERVLGELARLLGALAGGVRVTAAGDVHKLDRKRLAGVCDVGGPGPLPSEFPGWAGYEPELGLDLALLIQLGLIEAGAGQWRAAPAAARWVAMHAAAQWKSVLCAWRDLGRSGIGPPMDDLISACGGKRWVDADRLAASYAPFAPFASDPDQAAATLISVFIVVGMAIGALAAGGMDKATAIHLVAPAAAALRGEPVPLPDLDEPVVVQPDFEVFVPPRAPVQVFWDLERWAERIRVDRVARYRITRASVRARSRAGDSAEDWLERLQRAARFGVPDNVRASVLDWEEAGCQADMRMAVVLSFTGRPPSDWIPPPGSRRLADSVWAVDVARAPTVHRQLGDAGVQVDGDPVAWRRAAAVLAHPGALRSAVPSLPWPGPAPGDPRTAFADEPPAPGRAPGQASQGEVAAAAEADAASPETDCGGADGPGPNPVAGKGAAVAAAPGGQAPAAGRRSTRRGAAKVRPAEPADPWAATAGTASAGAPSGASGRRTGAHTSTLAAGVPPAPGRPGPSPSSASPAAAAPASPREIRRGLLRAEQMKRLVEVTARDGRRCAILPVLTGDRVRGRCVDCGADVDIPLADILALTVRTR